ncbi:MAG: T9SS type A sorting domain-containing protein, partial [Bacteroidota bacterium]
NSVTAVFADLIAAGQLTFVQGRSATGQVLIFSPFLPAVLNTLTIVEPGEGYIVSVNAPTTLEVCGTLIDPAFRPELHAGVNLVAYLPQAPGTPQEYFSNLFPGNLTFARGYSDGAYQNFSPFLPPSANSLMELINSRGYEVELDLPVNQGDWLVPPTATASRESDKATNRYVVVAASTNLGAEYVGEFAYVTNAEGEVFAIMEVIEGGYLMTTPVYENQWNPDLTEGVELFVEFSGISVPMDATFIPDSRLIFRDLTFEGLTSTEVTEEAVSYDLEFAPNPFQETMTINLSLGQAGKVSAMVLDMTGRKVMEVVTDELYPAGVSTITLDGRQLPAGSYMLNIIVDGAPMFQERIIRVK